MGRVHDAWNRVEAENLQTVNSPAEPVPAPDAKPVAVDSSVLFEHPGSARPAERTASERRKDAAPRPRQQWNPDRGRLVFLGGNGIGRAGAVIEQFRGVSARLYQIRQTRPITRILISSVRSKEGRTFVAANLAHVLAQQSGKRVLLIDGDLRNPGIHKLLGAPSEPGLSDYLAGETDAASVIQRGSIKGLFLIPGGRDTLDTAELLANGRLTQLLERASGFDWVVIDSPPAADVCDASIMADACDGVLLVVEATKTPSEMAGKVLEQFRGQSILGAVINRSDAFRSQTK